MKNVLVSDKIMVNDFTGREYTVNSITDDEVVVSNAVHEIKCSRQYANKHYVKLWPFKADDIVRLKEEYKSRYFTMCEDLTVKFIDLDEQDCIVKSLHGLYELVPCPMIESPLPSPSPAS